MRAVCLVEAVPTENVSYCYYYYCYYYYCCAFLFILLCRRICVHFVVSSHFCSFLFILLCHRISVHFVVSSKMMLLQCCLSVAFLFFLLPQCCLSVASFLFFLLPQCCLISVFFCFSFYDFSAFRRLRRRKLIHMLIIIALI